MQKYHELKFFNWKYHLEILMDLQVKHVKRGPEKPFIGLWKMKTLKFI
jgi:hypothetical protein